MAPSTIIASENETLLAAILSQVPVKGLDYKKLALDIGAPNASAAKKRWSRLKIKITASAGNSPSKPTGVQKAFASPPRKSTTPAKTEAGKEEDEGNSASSEDLPVTPVRRLPARKARVTNFKEEDEEAWEVEPMDERFDEDFNEQAGADFDASDREVEYEV